MNSIGHLTLVAGLSLAIAAPARAASSIPPTVETLAVHSVATVEARVTRVDSGQDPASGRLATYVFLDVERSIHGADGVERIVLREPGGRLGFATLVVDAAPQYAVGDHVLVFLDAARDGALRTQAMHWGRWSIENSGAAALAVPPGELHGVGPAGGPTPTTLTDLRARVHLARAPSRTTPDARFWHATPPELPRINWSGPDPFVTDATTAPRVGADAVALDTSGRTATVRAAYTPLSETAPTRWTEPDNGQTIPWVLATGGYPGGDAATAEAAVLDAMEAWTDVSESRVELSLTDNAFDWSTVGASPATDYAPVNGILFGDPYDDVPDMTGCTGVLAVGGYWRTGSVGSVLHGTSYHRALRGYIVFNNGFDCFAQTQGDIAEVTTHELGHALGFGHSPVSGAIMRSTAYGSRGAVLADDDRDAAHCYYPHTMAWQYPTGGERFTGGTSIDLSWSQSNEAAVDPGTVDLDVSYDGGQNWSPIVRDVPADAPYSWSVPETATETLRLRVSRSRAGTDAPAGTPALCSESVSPADAAIEVTVTVAGRVAGNTLRLDKDPGGNAALSWSAGCNASPDAYAVYAGTLSVLRQGLYDHAPLTCAASTTWQATEDGISRYFLVAPLAGGAEGDFASTSTGAPRPSSGTACAVREVSSVCP